MGDLVDRMRGLSFSCGGDGGVEVKGLRRHRQVDGRLEELWRVVFVYGF